MFKKQKLILILLGFIAAFIFAEIGLRIMGLPIGIYALDKETGLTILEPNKQFYWTKECYKNLIKSNSQGFHDFEFRKEKPINIFRVAIIGNSQVESLQVPLEKTWFKILEKKLNQELNSSQKFEVYAFGHSGNGQLLNYLYLKNYALKYKPDLIIDLFLVENDFRDDSCELTQKYIHQTGDSVACAKIIPELDKEGKVDFKSAESTLLLLKKEKLKPKRLLKKLASHSVLAVFLYHKYQLIKSKIYAWQNTKQTTREIDKIPVDFQVLLKHYPESWQRVWEIENQLVLVINKIIIDNKAKFLLVSSGGASRVHREDLRADYLNRLDFDKPEKIFQNFTVQHQISYLALTPILRKRALETRQKIMFSCDGHWNEIGHQWAADAIFNYLQEHPVLLNKQN